MVVAVVIAPFFVAIIIATWFGGLVVGARRSRSGRGLVVGARRSRSGHGLVVCGRLVMARWMARHGSLSGSVGGLTWLGDGST